MKCMLRRFNHYRLKYNKQIKDVESFCKKTLSSFSLSHNISSKQVRHVALVNTPGRKGTAVDYQKNTAVVLVRRSENKYITDNIASHSAAFLPVSDRKEYLIENTKYSINAFDFGYISANRVLKMANQCEFDEFVALYRKWKDVNKQAERKTRGRKRTLSDVEGGDVNDDSTKYKFKFKCLFFKPHMEKYKKITVNVISKTYNITHNNVYIIIQSITDFSLHTF